MRRLVGMALVSLATLTPSWAHADDQAIAQEILQKLQAERHEGNLKGFSIDLQVEDGTVWVKGHVASRDQQDLALDIARRADGVEQVVNELKVDSASRPKRSTAASPATKSSNLLANLKSGVSQAMGHKSEKKNATPKVVVMPVAHDNLPEPANDDAEMNAAGPSVQPVSVSQAVNAAPAVPQKLASDAIVQRIAHALDAEKNAGRLRGFSVDVQCDEGVVWLSGYVSSVEQHALVINIARHAPGVAQVVNDLRVGDGTNVEMATHQSLVANTAPQGTGVARNVRVSPAIDPMVHPQPMQRVPQQFPLTNAQPVPQYGGAPSQGNGMPLAIAPARMAGGQAPINMAMGNGNIPLGTPVPAHMPGPSVGIAPARFDHPQMPGYAWPSYAAYPNYAAVTYPKQYSPTAWPYIGPFYPYPQVPLGWRKVMLEWDDGWWYLDFKAK